MPDVSSPTLVDEAARSRIEVDHATPLVVEAGAGSGKTTHLVRRVAATLAAGVPPDQIVVITFTDKAARELVHRLRGEVDVSLDEAFVGTIHGFCAGILRRYPIEAGLPPAFRTADEITSGSLAVQRKDAAVRHVYDRALTEPAVADALAVVLGSAAAGSIASLAELLDQRWDQLATLALTVPDPAVLAAQLQRLREPVVRVAEHRWVSTSDDKLAAGVRAVATWLAQVDSLAEAARVDRQPKALHGQSKPWEVHTGLDVGAVREQCKQALAATTALAVDAALRTLSAVLAPVVADHAQARLASGELGFDDLLVLTHRLLTTNASVAAAVRSQHRRVFVDEFQDTDPVQFEILRALTDGDEGPVLFAVGDPKQSIYAFRQADVGLFRALADQAEQVGRRVELVTNFRTRPAVAAWINQVVEQRFAGHGHGVQAPFVPLVPHRPPGERAGPAVTVLGLDGGRPVLHDRAALASEAEAADIVATIRAAHGSWLVDDQPPRPAMLGDIAVLIRTRAGLGQLEVAMRAAEIPYRVEGGTLVYESREVYELLRVLQAIDDPSDSFALVTALRTSVFGLSDLDLHRYRHEGIADGRPRPWRVTVVDADAQPVVSADSDDVERSVLAVAHALHDIGRLSRHRHERSPAELLAQLYDGYLGAPAARFEGSHLANETWRRVRFVIDEARAWSDATAGTLREYLDWVAQRVGQVERSEVAPDEHEDSVRILTIHSAKGLEFPIVVVAGLGRRDMGVESRGLRFTHDGIEIKLGRLATAGYGASSADDAKEIDQAEEARMLYVALTRARDHVVVSMHSSTRSSPNAAERFAPAVADTDFATLNAGASDGRRSASDPLIGPDDDADEQAFVVELPARPDARARRVWTPSSIAKVLGDRQGPSTSEAEHGRTPTDDAALNDDPSKGPVAQSFDDDAAAFDDERSEDLLDDDLLPAHGSTRADVAELDPADPGHRKDPASSLVTVVSRGRYGTQVGSAVHEVMQRVDLDDARRGLEQLVSSAADHSDLPAGEPRERVGPLVASLLASDAFRRFAQAKSRRREMYVGAVDGEGAEQLTIWGYVDAVFTNANGTLTLLDYKTDTAFTTPDELAERYRAQVSGYAFALTRATGRPVGEIKLVVARADGRVAHEIDVEPLPAAELLGRLRAASAPPGPSTARSDRGVVEPGR